MTTELVIASYLGPRQRSCPEAVADPAWYLKQQLRRLSELKHGLSQITVVTSIAGVPAEAFLDDLPSKIRDTPLRLIRRENLGFSYGSFVVGIQQTTHDTLILSEDDYCFTKDHFDDIVKPCENSVTCAAVWNWAWRSAGPWGSPTPEQPVAAIFTIAAHTDALREALSKGWFGKPAISYAPDYATGCQNQISFSQALHQAGYNLRDWLTTYCSAYWDGEKICWYSRESEHRDSLILPMQVAERRVRIQLLDPPVREADPLPLPRRDLYATVHWDGTFTE